MIYFYCSPPLGPNIWYHFWTLFPSNHKTYIQCFTWNCDTSPVGPLWGPIWSFSRASWRSLATIWVSPQVTDSSIASWMKIYCSCSGRVVVAGDNYVLCNVHKHTYVYICVYMHIIPSSPTPLPSQTHTHLPQFEPYSSSVVVSCWLSQQYPPFHPSSHSPEHC